MATVTITKTKQANKSDCWDKMLINKITKAHPKAPKKRSRAGCIHCKEKKKKCNEERPQCDRCAERSLPCEYEPVKPRKRRRTSMSLSRTSSLPAHLEGHWNSHVFLANQSNSYDASWIRHDNVDRWESGSAYTYAGSSTDSDLSFQDQGSLLDLDEDVENIFQSNELTTLTLQNQKTASAAMISRNHHMDLAAIAPEVMHSPLHAFVPPMFMEFSDRQNRRALVDHFCNVLSTLIVFKEDTGNPFRQLILPLSHTSSPIMDAVYALSSAHLEYRGVGNVEHSLDFHNSALQGLARLLAAGGQGNREEVLGTIILLVYYEVLVQNGSSNIIGGHLRGASAIMNGKHSHDSSPTSLFLERAFQFYDVISALSLGTVPTVKHLPALSPFSYSTNPDSDHNNGVDTLLGMATDLWPLIHCLSALPNLQHEIEAAEAVGNLSHSHLLRGELETTSQSIEFALKTWTPSPGAVTSPPMHFANRPDSLYTEEPNRMQSILNNAEAYRQAALVYLYRYIRRSPRRSEQVQNHARRALRACSRVVEWRGPMGALLWPLFISACEAVEGRDRETAREAFAGIEKRQGMTNIAKAWEVLQIVWRNDDTGREICWRKICAEKGVSIVFG